MVRNIRLILPFGHFIFDESSRIYEETKRVKCTSNRYGGPWMYFHRIQ